MTTIVMAAQNAQGGGQFGFLLMMIAIFVIMWLFMIRPQQKRQKEIRNFQNSLQEGAKIVTGGGLHGTVKRIDIAAGTVDVVVTVDKGYVFASGAANPNAGNNA